MGGIAIFLAFTTACLIPCINRGDVMAILIGGALVFAVGVADDVRRVNAVLKLLFLFAAAGIMSTFGVVLALTPWYPVNLAITMLWIAGMVSAFNAIDNMNGLAGGVGFISSCFYFFVALQTLQTQWAIAAAALAGALAGFLPFNFPKARIFLGDSGSYFLGYVLAALGVLGAWSTHPVKAAIVPLLILSVPIFDLSYVVLGRHLQGTTKSIIQAIVYCGKDHLSHRLVELGMSETRAVLLIWFIAATVGAAAVTLRNSRPTEAVILLLIFAAVYHIITILLRVARRGHV